MAASAYPSAAGIRMYYQCPHNPANPRHAAAAPDHPRTVKAPETRLDQIVRLFFADHVFGPRRAGLLAAQLPATDAAAAADRDASAAAIQARLKQIDDRRRTPASSNSNSSPPTRPTPPPPRCAAGSAPGSPTCTREREQLDTQLAALAAATPRAADPALLDELPLAGDILPGLPPELKARLLDAFDIQVLWNKPGRQATVYAEITDATLQALPAILNPGQDGYDDTSEQASGEPEAMEDLFETPITATMSHRDGCREDHAGVGALAGAGVNGEAARLGGAAPARSGGTGRGAPGRLGAGGAGRGAPGRLGAGGAGRGAPGRLGAGGARGAGRAGCGVA